MYVFVSGRDLEQALGHGDGQGSLVCCSPWGHRELDTTERLSNSKNEHFLDITLLHT